MQHGVTDLFTAETPSGVPSCWLLLVLTKRRLDCEVKEEKKQARYPKFDFLAVVFVLSSHRRVTEFTCSIVTSSCPVASFHKSRGPICARTPSQPKRMVYLPPPQYASASRASYAEAYNKILATHRRSPLTSASSIIILVAPDVDALCAAKMLAQLFKQDDVMHKVVPVAGIADLEKTRDELITQNEVGP